VKQVDRLKIMAQWMRNEIETANFYDLDTVRAFKDILVPIAEALKAATEHTDVMVITVCHDTDRGGYWGKCDACGVISIVHEESDSVLDSVGLHMGRFHASLSLALAHEEITI